MANRFERRKSIHGRRTDSKFNKPKNKEARKEGRKDEITKREETNRARSIN